MTSSAGCVAQAFSPRAWGWSVPRLYCEPSERVLPTCVGMVRCDACGGSKGERSPHVRGDGPLSPLLATSMLLFSPRAWGWSDPQMGAAAAIAVLPTCVGMVRVDGSARAINGCSPHVRGDGPHLHYRRTAPASFSPRAWGWSVVERALHCDTPVLPTCVGMVRRDSQLRRWRSSSPHVRGDGPTIPTHASLSREFSPRAWGWSEDGMPALAFRWVLPTCVGMVRNCPLGQRTCGRSPHVRGDGPAS